MTALYVPPTDESDHTKQNMSLQLIGGVTSTNSTNITTNTSNIATNTANIATNTTNIATNTASIATLTSADANQVVGPDSATNNGFAVYDGTTGKLIKDHAATVALASEVSGTLPVLNGGTNYTGIAWSTFSPTVTAGTGSFSSVSASGAFLAIGKACWFTVTITITTVGTASGAITCGLPTGTAKRPAMIVFGETANVGTAGVGRIATSGSTMLIVRYDAGSLINATNVLTGSGVYELT